MTAPLERDPRWVDVVLDSRWTWLVARIALTSAYLIGGLTKLFDYRGAVIEQEHFGLDPGWLWASLAILVELGGSILIISGRLVWLGAGGIGVLTLIASLVANDFWNMQGHARSMGINTFFEHMGLIAGCVIAALLAEHERRLEPRGS
jgi:uncharacterized membrane protein YphA (DoxX/SURF4 family)